MEREETLALILSFLQELSSKNSTLASTSVKIRVTREISVSLASQIVNKQINMRGGRGGRIIQKDIFQEDTHSAYTLPPPLFFFFCLNPVSQLFSEHKS